MSITNRVFSWVFKDRLEHERLLMQDEILNARIQNKQWQERWEVESFLGKPVIYFSNEVQAPLIGFGERLELITAAKQPVLVIKDYVTNEEMMGMGRVRHYTEQLFFAAFNVDPNTLIALLYPNYDGTPVQKQPIGKQYTLYEVNRILTVNGFFDRLKQYREEASSSQRRAAERV
jgi:hypothetical protein